MKSPHHRLIIWIVSITIVATVSVQVYWNYISYQANKGELINQVQISLDNAIESYYADIAQGHSVTVTKTSDSLSDIDQIRHLIQQESFQTIDTLNKNGRLKLRTILKNFTHDSMVSFDSHNWSSTTAIHYDSGNPLHMDKIDSTSINLFASKIFVSMTDDALDFAELALLIQRDFDNKDWPVDFGLMLIDPHCASSFSDCDTLQTFGAINEKGQLMVTSQSTFIPSRSSLEIHFSNISSILFRRSIIGILLSLLLSGAIIFCLLYLFRTISQQKQLAEIKNDLISNITHEFKTPITTIGTALEGIENFGGVEDPEKTKKYLGISNTQLGKLNTMVEKLLETASIDSQHLQLHLESVDLTKLLREQLEKYRISYPGKSFSFECDEDTIVCNLDAFHIESAIENLLDNAVKYGGEVIEISLIKSDNEATIVNITDNGDGIAKDQRTKIFDKFYRIPSGNVHDVKGFGIGLYYARNIIEKHGGRLELIPVIDKTAFKIILPDGN